MSKLTETRQSFGHQHVNIIPTNLQKITLSDLFLILQKNFLIIFWFWEKNFWFLTFWSGHPGPVWPYRPIPVPVRKKSYRLQHRPSQDKYFRLPCRTHKSSLSIKRTDNLLRTKRSFRIKTVTGQIFLSDPAKVSGDHQ